jgi:two-component system response regulator ResD
MSALERASRAPSHTCVEHRRVLVVEDDEAVADIVRRYLRSEGYDVETVGDGLAAVARATVTPPDLVVLDLTLPGLDGLEVCRRLRATMSVPIIIVSARGDESDRIAGLEAGADDYLGKPFSPRELVARVRAVLRRLTPQSPSSSAPALTAGTITVDPRARSVTVAGRAVELRPREFDLLAFLMSRPGEAVQRETLLEQVWGYSFGGTATVSVHVRRLREKVEADPANPRHIKTVWSVGYRFDP